MYSSERRRRRTTYVLIIIKGGQASVRQVSYVRTTPRWPAEFKIQWRWDGVEETLLVFGRSQPLHCAASRGQGIVCLDAIANRLSAL